MYVQRLSLEQLVQRCFRVEVVWPSGLGVFLEIWTSRAQNPLWTLAKFDPDMKNNSLDLSQCNTTYMNYRICVVPVSFRAVFNWVSKVISKLLWFCITSLSDWFKVLAPLYQPIRSKTKISCGSRVHIFPRFVLATCGLMVSALDSGSSSPGSGPGRGHCVVFLGKTLYSHGASLHPGV